jgi:aspartyl protease family protein
LIAAVVWLGLLAGGWFAFEQFGNSGPVVRGCQGGAANGDIVLAAARDGHFYLEGAVSGTPVRFLVDTGASHVTLGADDARRARLAPGTPAYFETANGRVEGRLVQGQKVRAECLEVDDLMVAVSPGLGEVALLGQNFLRRFEVVQSGSELRLRMRAKHASPEPRE